MLGLVLTDQDWLCFTEDFLTHLAVVDVGLVDEGRVPHQVSPSSCLSRQQIHLEFLVVWMTHLQVFDRAVIQIE